MELHNLIQETLDPIKIVRLAIPHVEQKMEAVDLTGQLKKLLAKNNKTICMIKLLVNNKVE